MISVSQEFLSALKNGAEQNIRLEFASGAVIDKVQISASGGFRYQQILNRDGDMQMGNAIMSSIEVSLLNIDGYFDGFDFSEECTAKYGVKVGDEYQYINLGVFKGDRVNRTRSRTFQYSANDRMSVFEKDASEFIASLKFPIELYQIFRKLCDYVGVGWSAVSCFNGAKPVPVNPFRHGDYTCREVLSWIAEAMCSYAVIDRNGKCNLVWFGDADYTVPKSDRFELNQSEIVAPPVSRLEVYTSYSDMLNTSGSGDNLYTIADNPFLYAENDDDTASLQVFADNIYTRLADFPEYYPSSFRAVSNPAIECGDIIRVVSDDGTEITFPVFVQTIQWSGSGKTEYENTGNPRRENVPVAQRELSNLKKEMLKATDLVTAVESYLNTAEGKASIVQTVSGSFVKPDDLSEYATTTQLTQSVNALDAEISLTAAYGSGTIGSNVRAMLTLFANADSSSIKLKADAIDLTGYVTVTALETAGATTINGANVTTDNLYVRKIYGTKNADVNYEDIAIISSAGRNIAIGNGGTSGLATNLTIWANNISFASKNASADSDYLVISTVDTTGAIDGISYKYQSCIYPYNYNHAVGSGEWAIGNEEYPFGKIYLDNSIYIFDRDSEVWTRLYVSNGNLYWRDVDGVRHTIVSS